MLDKLSAELLTHPEHRRGAGPSTLSAQITQIEAGRDAPAV